MSPKISIADVIPAQMPLAIYATKVLGRLIPEWDIDHINAAARSLEAAMSTHGIAALSPSKGQLAVGNLLFWIEHIPDFNVAVYPHPKFAFSSFLTEAINDVWDAQPDLIGSDVLWASGTGDIQYKYNLAEVLCMHGILLDPQVLKDGPKQVLHRAFASKRCITLAVSKYHLGVLELIASLSPAARTSVYTKLCTPLHLATVVSRASTSLVVDTRYALHKNGIRPHAEFSNSRVMTAQAARRLLTGMAEVGVKSPQMGWSSGCKQVPREPNGDEMQCALKVLAGGALTLAIMGYCLEDLRQLVGAVGTIVGYTPECVGEKSLASEFAGAFSLELVRTHKNNFPSNPSNGAIWARHEGNPSFLDGVLGYFVESDIAADDVVGIVPFGLMGSTLRYAFKASDLPVGTIESYESMCRARHMASVIASAGAGKVESIGTTRRQGMRV